MRFDSERAAGEVFTRRQLLGLATGILMAGCRRPPYDPARFVRPPRSPIALLPAASYDVDFADLIGRGLRELRVDVAGRRVLLKPNMVEYEPGTSINTHPLVVAGAAEAMLRAGAASVVVGEGPGHRRDIEYLLDASGLGDRLTDLSLRFVDLNHDDVEWVPLGARFTGLERLALPAALGQADLVVSMPKLKTHHWAGLTCSMKNLFGVVPGAVYGCPKNLLHIRGIAQSIIDLAATVRPGLVIVDGVVGMEGDGPIMGQARHVGFVGLSTDLVALDATCARIIGLDPRKITYLDVAGRFLGNLDPERLDSRGEPAARFATRFEVLEPFREWQLAVS